ncbi:MAG: hypothetical protein Q4G58_06745 [bacterium]|nr:hypothetical protein [bacterium]
MKKKTSSYRDSYYDYDDDDLRSVYEDDYGFEDEDDEYEDFLEDEYDE